MTTTITHSADYNAALQQYLKNAPPGMEDQIKKAFDEALSRVPQEQQADFLHGALANQPKTPEDLAQQELDYTKGVQQQNRSDILGYLKGLPGVGAAGGAASASDEQALRGLTGSYMDTSQLGVGDFAGDAGASAAGAAKGDASALGTERQMLGKLASESDPHATAKERFLYEQQRQAEEQGRRSAMQAALSQLGAQGNRSGGAVMGAFRDASQQTGNARKLGDLGVQAGAVDRAMQATQAAGQLGGSINQQVFGQQFQAGTAADIMGRFNASQRQDYQQYADAYKANQQNQAWSRASDLFGAKQGTAQQVYGNTQTGNAANERGIALLTGQYHGDTAPVVQASQTGIGAKASQDAIDQLTKKKFDITNPSTWF